MLVHSMHTNLFISAGKNNYSAEKHNSQVFVCGLHISAI